jgi:hypothetical protein
LFITCSFIFIPPIYIYIGTPSWEYMSNTTSERERVYTKNNRIWTIRSDEKELLTTLFFAVVLGCWLISLIVLKWGEIDTHVGKVGKYICIWRKSDKETSWDFLASTLLIMIKLIRHNLFAYQHNFDLCGSNNDIDRICSFSLLENICF